MALASAASRVGGGAKIAIFWRISADFDPISEGTRQRPTGRETRASVAGGGPAGPVAGGWCQRSRCGDCGPVAGGW